jgi:hypothetical protein
MKRVGFGSTFKVCHILVGKLFMRMSNHTDHHGIKYGDADIRCGMATNKVEARELREETSDIALENTKLLDAKFSEEVGSIIGRRRGNFKGNETGFRR